MTDETTLEALQAQESGFVFDSFDQATAWAVGSAAVDVITERGLSLAVQIVLRDHIVFKAAIGGVAPDTDEWLAGKALTARHFDQASLHIRFRKDADPSFLYGLDQEVYKTHGGSVPIRVAGEGTVGTITCSGEPDLVDHAVAIEALRRVILK
jgi:uncharacterized protein (UPF0303 family)